MESTQQVGPASAAGSDMTACVCCSEVCAGSDGATKFGSWAVATGYIGTRVEVVVRSSGNFQELLGTSRNCSSMSLGPTIAGY